jgi:tRNA CCA-adding enzyme
MSILNKIRIESLKKIRPTKADLKESATIFKKVYRSIQLELDARNIEAAFIELEGSSGRKQTQLRGWKELDVFVGLPVSILPQSWNDKKTTKPLIRRLMKKMVKDVACNAAKRAGAEEIQIAYAEHPYVIARLDEYWVDIVFCFDLTKDYIAKNGPITAVDRTPHHSNFVHAHLTKTQRDDVRLLKAFFQSSFVYGDSSPIGRSGFTGFSTEMLIFHLQTLESSLEFLCKQKPEPLDFFNRASDSLRQKFPHDFIIISDPIDPNRNIASSISKRAYHFTTHRAHQLLQCPSNTFFERRPIPQLSLEEQSQLEPNYFVIEFNDRTGWHYTKTRDKLYRYFSQLSRFLRQETTGEPRFGAVTFEEVFHKNIFTIALHVENVNLSPSYLRPGPRQDHVEGVTQFLEKHPSAFLKNERYYCEILRPFTNAEQALQSYLSKKQISPKIQIIDVTRGGSTQIGKQALWILIKCVQPFTNPNQ